MGTKTMQLQSNSENHLATSRHSPLEHTGPQGPQRVRRMIFTDRLLKSLTVEPGRKDRLVFDDKCPKLGVRITAAGTKSFLVQWTDRATGRKIREPLGVWGSTTIEKARTAAEAVIGDVARGVDRAAERQRKKAEAEASRAEAALTLDRLIDDWAALHLSQRRPRYAGEAQRALRYAFAAHLSKPATKLTRAVVIDVLDGMTKRGNPTTAGRTLAYGRACYTWARKRGKVPSSPFTDLPMASATSERDRALTDAEVVEVWAAAGTLPYPWGPYYRLALLTLQRREEVAGIRWSELSADLVLWRIPGSRMKTGKPHDCHLVGTGARRAALDPAHRGAGSHLQRNGQDLGLGLQPGETAARRCHRYGSESRGWDRRGQ